MVYPYFWKEYFYTLFFITLFLKTMKPNLEQLEEVNSLFELIKTMLLTWLSREKANKLLKDFTHSEIRKWKYENWSFIIIDLIVHD